MTKFPSIDRTNVHLIDTQKTKRPNKFTPTAKPYLLPLSIDETIVLLVSVIIRFLQNSLRWEVPFLGGIVFWEGGAFSPHLFLAGDPFGQGIFPSATVVVRLRLSDIPSRLNT